MYPEFGHGLTPNPGLRTPSGTGVVAGGNDTRLKYLTNLAAVRNATLHAGIPMWNYFGAGAYVHKGQTHIDSTEAELRWQMSASIAFGARGLLWFFFTPEVHKIAEDGPAWPGLVSDDGAADHVTEHWYQARRLNSAVLALAPTLMQLRSTAALVLRQSDTQWDDEGHPVLRAAGCGLVNISRGDFIVGCFARSKPATGARWTRAVVVANFDHADTQWPTVAFDSPGALEVNAHTGQEEPLVDEVAGLPGMQLGLLAGGRRLLLLR